MGYVVRHGEEVTEAFKSLIGVLTGDTASPILWNLYFADLDVPDHKGDVQLSCRIISHVEQADDVVLFSTDFKALQVKAEYFLLWCGRNSMTISVTKTKWMIFGVIPNDLQSLYINGQPIELVPAYKYVGIWLTSTERYIFKKQYLVKASKARNAARATFAAQPMIGSLPPKEGIRLYMARIDPHLTFGCEVVLDVDLTLVGELEDVQHMFLRRLLGVNNHSILAILFSETGLLPVRYRRLQLALGYLKYLIQLPLHQYASAAFHHSCSLYNNRASCWIGDIIHTLKNLPVPVHVTLQGLLHTNSVDAVIGQVAESWESSLRMFVQEAARTFILRKRVEYDGKGVMREYRLWAYRSYLDLIRVPSHRKAYFWFVTSNHHFAVELLRYTDRRYQTYVPREWRKCRFGCDSIEDEFHVTLRCDGSLSLQDVRRSLHEDLSHLMQDWDFWSRRLMDDSFLLRILFDESLVARVAKFIYDMGCIFHGTKVYTPDLSLYS
ncbi:hypothetical protein K435DRAFT_747737 [Dendrothele bispora CBS 962.96]|uniref:Reverse transcriptase domain-containing protein n=1 Tax=Dendrothele bispora (strain CBS 962.96) TaxID=1314807 RepID=A0A4S8MKX2_DENBC|nr:hypothetical protein K435DRAFT_747737 [Dendrothele bispora CBS 962.96]